MSSYFGSYIPPPKKKPPAKAPAKKPAPAPAAAKPLTLAQQAAQQVDLQLQPQIADVTNAYQSNANTLKAAYDALAQMRTGVAPQIEQTYQTAANSTAGFAKGFSDAVASRASGAATTANEHLAQMGSPQEIVSNLATGGSDALYATGGYIPASSLAREGAAFSTAARNLPAQALGLGIDATKQAGLQRIDALKQIEQTRPQLLQQALAGLQANQAAQGELKVKQQAQALNQQLAESEFGLKVGKAKADVTYKTAKAKQDAQFKQAKLDQDAYFKGANLNLATTKEHNRAASQQAKLNRGGFTASQKIQFKKRAGTIAAQAWNGKPTTQVNADGQRVPGTTHLTYQEAMKLGLSQGIPLSVMQAALNQFWGTPGFSAPWETAGSGEGRPLLSFQQRTATAKRPR